MTVVALPSKVYFESVDKFQLLRAGVTLRSKYTGKRQAVKFPFALWVFEGKLVPMEGLDAGEWRAFLTDLEGDQNTFLLPVPGYDGPSSGYSGPSPTLGADGIVRSRSVSLTGMTPSTTVLNKGDYITINNELKVVTSPVATDGSGNATGVFQPSLRKAAPTGTAVRIYDPYIYLAAADSESGTWSLSRPVRHGITLKAVEAVE